MSSEPRSPVEQRWPGALRASPRTVVVRFGESSDGAWWASLPGRRQLHHAALGELFVDVRDVVRHLFGDSVTYELLRVEPRRRLPAGQGG